MTPIDRIQRALEASGWLNCDPEDWEAVKAQLPPDGAVAWLRLPNLDIGQRMTLMANGEEFEIVRPGELAELKADADRLKWLLRRSEKKVEHDHFGSCHIQYDCAWSTGRYGDYQRLSAAEVLDIGRFAK